MVIRIIPIISAIGHETDTTIIDLVSDLRASTPTAAAEKIVPVKYEIEERLKNLNLHLNNKIKFRLQSFKDNFEYKYNFADAIGDWMEKDN